MGWPGWLKSLTSAFRLKFSVTCSWKCKSKGTLIKVMKRHHHFYLWKKFCSKMSYFALISISVEGTFTKEFVREEKKAPFMIKLPYLGFFVTQYNSNSKNCWVQTNTSFYWELSSNGWLLYIYNKGMVRVAQSIFFGFFL